MKIDLFVWTPVFMLILRCFLDATFSVTTLDLTGSDFFMVNMGLIKMLVLFS